MQLKPISQLEKTYQITKIQFLPDAGGELDIVFNNYTTINNRLETLGKIKLEAHSDMDSRRYDYWSSSEKDSYDGWRRRLPTNPAASWDGSAKTSGWHNTRCIINLVQCGEFLCLN